MNAEPRALLDSIAGVAKVDNFSRDEKNVAVQLQPDTQEPISDAVGDAILENAIGAQAGDKIFWDAKRRGGQLHEKLTVHAKIEEAQNEIFRRILAVLVPPRPEQVPAPAGAGTDTKALSDNIGSIRRFGPMKLGDKPPRIKKSIERKLWENSEEPEAVIIEIKRDTPEKVIEEIVLRIRNLVDHEQLFLSRNSLSMAVVAKKTQTEIMEQVIQVLLEHVK